MKFIFFSIRFFISILVLTPSFSFASDDWCISDMNNPPCGGQPGKCIRNGDGSEGGFVAETARVIPTFNFYIFKRSPHIGIHAQVCDRAQISDNAKILDYSRILENARISENAMISDNAEVSGNARVHENARVFRNARVFGDSRVSGNAAVFGNAQISGSAWVSDHSRILDSAEISDSAWIYGNAKIFDRARVFGSAHVYGNAQASGDGQVFGSAQLAGYAWVLVSAQVFVGLRIGDIITEDDDDQRRESIDMKSGPVSSLKFEAHPIHFETDYEGSEAHSYREYLDQRYVNNQWVQSVVLNGEAIDISTFSLNDEDVFDPGYQILNSKIASHLSPILGREIQNEETVRLSEIRANAEASELIASCREDDYRINPYAFSNESSQPEPLRSESHAYLEWIRNQISNQLNELNASPGAEIVEIPYENARERKLAGLKESYEVKYFRHPRYPSDSGIYVHNRSEPVYMYAGALFFEVMNAIRDNNEIQFIQNMINLATVFHPSKINARNGFLEAYTYLYVAKRFPNRFTRNRFLHFTLRCGGIY